MTRLLRVAVAALAALGGEPVGEILVWVSEGRVTLLEQAWFTDDPPTTWPPMESVRIS